jgi:hypothetical protein
MDSASHAQLERDQVTKEDNASKILALIMKSMMILVTVLNAPY